MIMINDHFPLIYIPELDKSVVAGVDDVAVAGVDDGVLVVVVVLVVQVVVFIALSVSHCTVARLSRRSAPTRRRSFFSSLRCWSSPLPSLLSPSSSSFSDGFLIETGSPLHLPDGCPSSLLSVCRSAAVSFIESSCVWRSSTSSESESILKGQKPIVGGMLACLHSLCMQECFILFSLSPLT